MWGQSASEMDAETKKPFGRKFIEALRRHFAGGVLVTVPVVVTVAVLYFFFQKVDGLLSPLLRQVLGYSIPGMGIVATGLLVILAGVITHNISRLYELGELVFIRTPLVRAIYSAVKQLVEAIALPQKKVFDQVVLIEYPRKGILTLALASSKFMLQAERLQGEYVSVFVPSTPTPVSGWVVMVPRREVIVVELTPEEAVKILVSGGIATPPYIRERSAVPATESIKELVP
jgi:uncharacterized membrane protein